MQEITVKIVEDKGYYSWRIVPCDDENDHATVEEAEIAAINRCKEHGLKIVEFEYE
jgi:hypothetical protein